MSSNVASPVLASRHDGTYPRPQLVRTHWRELDGQWGFAFDDDDRGLAERWYDEPSFDREITVPFPFESSASGIGETGFHPVVWYSRAVTHDDLVAAGRSAENDRVHLRFGAVDHRADVWVDGHHVGGHEGGHTPFSFDITDVLDAAAAAETARTHTIVVRAQDDPLDVTQPRGKQDWRAEPHVIWYHRTSGIWQPVWLEATPSVAVTLLHWVTDLQNGLVSVRVDLSRRPAPGTTVDIDLHHEGESLGSARLAATSTSIRGTVHLPGQHNGQAYEELVWTPETPTLIDATVTLTTAADARGAVSTTDTVYSYLGLRSASVEHGRFLLNDRPYYVRSVLEQGYWPTSHLAAPSADALRAEVAVIKELGFNAARIHQKIEDPRFLYWADRLGLLIWGEAPGTFEFSSTAVRRTIAEWTEAVERDLSHPSIVTWVPLNESWGIQHVAHSPAQQAFARALVDITRALDPSRPVISNDGWEHVDSDIISVHDYDWTADVLRPRYLDEAAKERLLDGFGPAGRRIVLDGQPIGDRPVMLTEFGGVSFATTYTDDDAWGYSTATSADDFLARLETIVGAVADSSFLAGFCYTQITDTLQETNGLLDEERRPKAPVERLRRIITRRG